MNTLPPDSEPAPAAPPSAYHRVVAAFDRITEVDRPELWTTLRDVEAVLVDAKAVDERLKAGEDLPLAGKVLAVTELIDVAGLPTSAGCPSRAWIAETSATVVSRLTAAGAVVLGKTDPDHFGLGGTRAPFGLVAAAWDPHKVAGGSSSGSAVAVALGIADLALGTDTAASARVPAALNAVAGLKPTHGLLPMTGVLTHRFGAVALFAESLAGGRRALAVMTGPDGADPAARAWPADVRLGAGEHPRVAIPDRSALSALSLASRLAFTTAANALRASGALLEPIDIGVFRAAANIVHNGSFDAESLAARRKHAAHQSVVDRKVAALKVRAAEVLGGFDALLMPTVAEHPDIVAAHRDPADVSRKLGALSAFATVLDFAAVTVPVLPGDRRPFGVTFYTRAFEDQIGLDLAAVCTGEPMTHYPAPGADVVVFGAHLRGQPLNERLTAIGARFTAPVRTAEHYRMVLLPADPPQPAVLDDADGGVLDGELWRLSPGALDRFAAELPEPFKLTPVELEDGSTPLAVRCEPAAARGAPRLDRYESWRGYLRFASTAGLRDCG